MPFYAAGRERRGGMLSLHQSLALWTASFNPTRLQTTGRRNHFLHFFVSAMPRMQRLNNWGEKCTVCAFGLWSSHGRVALERGLLTTPLRGVTFFFWLSTTWDNETAWNKLKVFCPNLNTDFRQIPCSDLQLWLSSCHGESVSKTKNSSSLSSPCFWRAHLKC